MIVGFSLIDDVLIGGATEPYLAGHKSVRELVSALKAGGVGSYELRKLPRVLDSQAYQTVNSYVQQIWEMGLQITVHGELPGGPTGERFVDEYPSMAYILQHFRNYQDEIVMTVHAHQSPRADTAADLNELNAQTVAHLKRWSMMVAAEGLPIYFALENNRAKESAIDPGNSTEIVTEMVKKVGHTHTGICWDMGHFYSNLLTGTERGVAPGQLDVLPPKAFLERVYHTHIHGLNDRGKTHFPLSEGFVLPLEAYVQALQRHGYGGVYNLELSFDRYEPGMPVMERVFASVGRLKGLTIGS